MPRKTKVESVEELDSKIEEALTEPKTEFTVLNPAGAEIRTYSQELHGERAEELAHEYAGKIGGSVR
jgi:hypothetical protein